MEALIPITLFIATFWSIAYITQTISDNRVRRELINNQIPEDVIKTLFLGQRAENVRANLKWGLVTVAFGLALGLNQLFGLSNDDPLAYGLVMIAGGAALLLYYRLSATEDSAD